MNAVFARLLGAHDFMGIVEIQSAGTEWMGEGTLERLTELGFFVPAGVRTSFVCMECERQCELEPRKRIDGDHTGLEARCRKMHVVLDVDPSQLQAWRFSPDAVGQWLASSLELLGEPKRLDDATLRLGERRIGNRRVEVCYVPSLRTATPIWARHPPAIPPGAVVFLGSVAPQLEALLPGRTTIAIEHLLDSRQKIPMLDPRIVHSALGFKLTPAKRPCVQVPPGTSWPQVIMRIFDDETVEVIVGTTVANLTPDDFGLTGQRGKGRIVRAEWQLLLDFAEAHGDLDRDLAPSEGRIRQRLARLREALRKTFKIDDDPFFPRPNEGGWSCHFLISRWDSHPGIRPRTSPLSGNG